MFNVQPAFALGVLSIPSPPVGGIDEHFSSVVLLARFNGVDGSDVFIDESTRNIPLQFGAGAAIRSYADASGGSALFRNELANGSVFGQHPDIAFGTGDFTVECFAKEFNASGQHGVFQFCTPSAGAHASNANLAALRGGGGNWAFYAGGQIIFSSIPVSTNVRTHIAMCRQAGILYIFVNGELAARQADTFNYTGPGFILRNYYSYSYTFDGYIDDVRVTRGIARYTAAFTPPSETFPTA